ncbi:MAG: DUF4230 domain-containing protein [Novosphingobium sp.]|uniref:DUF4230 domain-containing protein n=1 Tax=Novosphingobium sp. TaxID=1874826 RepID=UPI003C79E273
MASALSERRAPWLLTGGALALAGFFAWQLYGPQDHGDPITTSLAAFEKANRLTVFSAQLALVSASEDERAFGMLKSRQVAVIPARVDYTIDLAQMDQRRMKWDAATKHLDVTLPPLQLSRPNLDEAHAQYLREGVWITGTAQAKLTRDNTLVAEKQAADQARNPALLTLARGAAKDAVRQNLAIPLQVAGYGAVEVTVHFEGEPAP